MSQAGTGEFGPRTLPGRVLAIVWTVASIIAIVTAGVTSLLTTKALEGLVRGESDRPSVRVADVTNASSNACFDGERIRHRGYATPQDRLRAPGAGAIDAFVYDRPLLQWIVAQNFSSSVEVPDTTFDSQQYAIALPPGSALRKPINVAVLQAIEGDWWKQTLLRYFGEK